MILTLQNVSKIIKDDRVVHCCKSPYDVLIDRTTPYGNPFKLNEPLTLDQSVLLYGDDRHAGLLPNRKEILVVYDNYVRKNPELLKELVKLEGKILGCWCSPKLCHGHAIMNIIDEHNDIVSELFEY